jgi:hypothetical protein
MNMRISRHRVVAAPRGMVIQDAKKARAASDWATRAIIYRAALARSIRLA